MSVRYYLQYKAAAVELRIAVNDVPVVIRSEPTTLSETVPINAWLGDEPSEIRIEATGGLEGDAPIGGVDLALISLTGGADERILLSTSCPRDATSDELVIRGSRWTLRKALRLDGLSLPPSEVWPKARAVVLTDGDRVEIHELVMSIQKAFDEGDAQVLERELSLQHAEIARSQHCTVADVRRGLAAALGVALREEPEDEAVDIESEEGLAHLDETMQLHLVARDRLVWVTRDGYKPALWIPATGPGYRIPLYLAKRDDRWVVVR